MRNNLNASICASSSFTLPPTQSSRTRIADNCRSITTQSVAEDDVTSSSSAKQLSRLPRLLILPNSLFSLTFLLIVLVLIILPTSQAASIKLRRPDELNTNTLSLLRRLAAEYEEPATRSTNYILRIMPLDNNILEYTDSVRTSGGGQRTQYTDNEDAITTKFDIKKRNNAEMVNHILKNFSNLGRLGDVGRR